MVALRTVRRRFGAVFLTLGLTATIGAVTTQPAAASQPVYPVMNTSEYPPDGIYFRNAPDWNQTSRVNGWGVFAGDSVQLLCWNSGTNVPRQDGGSNTVWYLANNVTRPTAPGPRANSGWINAHFVNDGTGPNQVAPGVEACVNGQPPVPPTTAPPPPPPPPAGGAVYFQPRWTTGDPYPTDDVLTISKEKWSSSVSVARSKSDCRIDKVDDYVPTTRNGKRVTTMGTWSVARLAPIYMIEQNFTLAKQFNFIVLYDPGSYANYFDKSGCDQFFDESGDLKRWLDASDQNVLMILAGRDTYDPNWLGKGSHQGIQQKLFPKIRGTRQASQVYVCNYNTMSHPDVLWNFRGVMSGGRTTSCPRGISPWHP